MKEVKIKKIIIALIMISVTHIAMGSFTGNTKKKSSDLYSLKNFNKSLYKKSAGFSLRSGFEYRGTRFLNQSKDAVGNITLNTIIRFENGNTTYIYPYSHKVTVPKFKTPTPPSLR